MADKTVPIYVPSKKPIKIVKLKVKQGAFVLQGQVLFSYSESLGDNLDTKKFKATQAGTICSIKVKEGDILEPANPIAELEECRHPTVMKEMCAECGADLRVDSSLQQGAAVVPMVHSVPELKVSEELAQKLGREDAERLLKDRKLVLLVDLDQTLVHTTNETVPPNLKGVSHYFLRGLGGPGRWYHTRLRPGTREFLASASKYYELHVCTFGARQYAHAVAELLDPEKKYFSHRILSRDECFDARAKAANLKALFPCGDNMVCIIDDREDVWRHATNLIHVRPYTFFQCTGDINAPPMFDEKTQLISGKNGSQVPIIHQMPTLDPDPDNKESTEEKAQKSDAEENQTKIEVGGNGKIVKSSTDEGSEESKSKESENVQIEAETVEPKWTETSDGQIEIDDPDDYLIYLEDILKNIHKYFYELYDKMGAGQIPDLKTVVPEVKSRVLSGFSLVFSGLVPTHQKLETSRAYLVAKSLGAELLHKNESAGQLDHVPLNGIGENQKGLCQVNTAGGVELPIDAFPGTAKVNASRRMVEGRRLHVVTPEWLWSCAERWERVDERLYPLQRGGQASVFGCSNLRLAVTSVHVAACFVVSISTSAYPSIYRRQTTPIRHNRTNNTGFS
ncbi:RNA polymerase II subunit A C-terminal domain phosphatase [Eumeta japonica]|uniref:RNA polymerase II subunit A C-terminal domain phosphatase n=1 Tax=Eumeta variegata TaxID=151549 RepID=A0A4C1XQI9_EUMVA|nr:RNA polymerase II subunit A C-terminal domain phosphatase [Eumeta japonica]